MKYIYLLSILLLMIIINKNYYEQFDGENNKMIIIMATYNRKNGKTPFYLRRSMDSIINQSNKNWDLIIIGDKFEPYDDLLSIIDEFKLKTENKIVCLDNQLVERDFIKNKGNLWYSAGATSINLGLKYARENNYKYYAHLDDDDYWTNNHVSLLLDTYNKYPNCVFVNTKSTYKNSYLPYENMDVFENNRLPIPNGTIHSSFSFRIDILPFYYKTALNEYGIDEASDANMLQQIKTFIEDNKQYSSIYISELTCYHDIEGEERDTFKNTFGLK